MIVRIVLKPINPDWLREELAEAGLMEVITSLGWTGFVATDPRRYDPATERRVVGVSSVNGVRTEDHAEPGELRIATRRDLTGDELARLQTILAGHDATERSNEQIRQDQDETDLDRLAVLYSQRGLLSALQGEEARNLLMRLILRRERGAAV